MLTLLREHKLNTNSYTPKLRQYIVHQFCIVSLWPDNARQLFSGREAIFAGLSQDTAAPGREISIYAGVIAAQKSPDNGPIRG